MPYNKEAAEQFKQKYKITIGSARNRLMRSIMFALLKEANHHFCYRCGEEMTLQDYTIEHIEPWAYKDNSWDLFFDLSNIAFSHSKCNSSHVRRYTKHALAHREKHFGATATNVQKGTRRCFRCKEWKPLGSFVKNKSKTHGRGHVCIECRRTHRREEYHKKKLDTNNE